MRPCAVFINEQALATAPKSGPQIRHVMDFIRSLANNPDTIGDFPEKDSDGRTVQVKIIGRFAVTYWVDHPVCEIKITHIKPADK